MADRKRTFKWLLMIAGLLGSAVLLIVFIQLRRHQGGPLPLPDTATEALMTLANVHQTATQDGKVQFELNAESAQLEAAGRRMILTSPSVVFYLEDGSRARLTAARGVFDTRSNDMAVSGNVRLRNDRYTLATEALSYRHQAKMLDTDVPVDISGGVFDLRADTMTYNLETNTAIFDGRVKGRINEDMDL